MSRRVHLRTTAPASWIALLAVAGLLVGTIGTHRHEDPPGPVWLAVVLAVAAGLPLLLVLPTPGALLTSGLLTAVYFAAGYADGPVYLAIPAVAVADVSAGSRRPWRWAAAAASLGVAGLVARDLWHGADRPTLWQCIGLVAMVGAASSLATAIRSQRAASVEQARIIASEERLRMAAHLHDGVGHGLAVIAMQAGAALHVLDKPTATVGVNAVRENLEAIRDTSQESLALLRGQLSQLASDGSAPRSPAQGISDLPALVDRVGSGGLEVALRIEADPDLLTDRQAQTAYAVAQEGLTNVLRHAGATRTEVTLRQDVDSLVVRVADNGQRAVPGDGVSGGLGIAGLRARVEDLGGRLVAGRGSAGFVLQATIPTGTAP